MNFLPLLEQWKDIPCENERSQSYEHPGWGAEQEGNSWVISKRSSEGGEEDAKRERDNDTGDTSCRRQVKHAPGIWRVTYFNAMYITFQSVRASRRI